MTTKSIWSSVRESVRHAIRIRIPRFAIEDLTQDVLVDLVSQWGNEPPDLKHAMAYAQVVAVNKCKAWLKAHYRVRWVSLDALRGKGAEFDTKQRLGSAESSRIPEAHIQYLYKQLRHTDRMVLDLHFLNGIPLRSIARVMRLGFTQVQRSSDRILREARRLGPDLLSLPYRDRTS